MPDRPFLPPRVYVHTLGCPKNEADSRTVMRSLTAAGVVVVKSPERATHILLNTCGFIREAKEESIEAILDACKGYPGKTVVAMGCLVERYRAELSEGIPEVAAWFGLVDGPEGPELIRLFAGAGSGDVSVAADDVLPPAKGLRSSYAYVKISDGCDELCTFCAIPAIKGPYHSLAVKEILREADACLAEGARELVLVGQDTACWTDGDIGLVDLLALLAADDRVYRLRVMYLQPERVTEDLLCRMAEQAKVCRYLDIPFQHSHPEILRNMARWGEGRAYLDLLERARSIMPDVAVRTSLIVGFPRETETHFEHLVNFVQQAQFDYAGGFVYSPEEGTSAATFRPRVKRAVAVKRLNRLNELLQVCGERRRRLTVGSSVDVMIDSLESRSAAGGSTAVGRTRGQAPEVDGVTHIEGGVPPGTEIGDIVTVTVGAAVGHDLVGVCDAT